ncbi:ribonucleoside-diphosphate reductase class Ib glutaredoxin subunit [Pelagirhabdus alkalitolerans]|uniref:Ribonucleoside-diphosphate reductase class Ib glutaredoxin subunit n=1 Tax=Pelagirhabdus alkalitolerans TaxID=1612202 RepID=A0A1G6JFS5_9BACI|nr:glutaredoxin family protein [Pelagirhabdus alkalitolerans]SDC17594.1 ribonucleoside-diphosphate reductase class Ib glutaredoxin subunit [Pelagirhabdus alkalitolerans]
MSKETLTVYISEQCRDCDRVTDLLNQLGASYQEKNISENRTYLKELQALSIFATPVVMTEDRTILGYQESKIKNLVDRMSR